MPQTDPSKRRFAFGIESFYGLVAVASGAMLATGESEWVEQARVFLRIDMLIILVAGLAYLFVLKDVRGRSLGPLQAFMGFLMLAFFVSPWLESISWTLRHSPVAWSEPELAFIAVALAYDVFVRIVGLQRARRSDPMPNFTVLTVSDLAVMIVLDQIAREGRVGLVQVPACYVGMVMARLALKAFFRPGT